jgi:hypothetical protein
MKDIFPSLHTAAPVWFALYAARRARVDRSRAWAWVAGVTAVFASHIVGATIVLRWHYVVDVVAGLALAAVAAWSAPRLASAERELRARLGWPSAWSFGESGAEGPAVTVEDRVGRMPADERRSRAALPGASKGADLIGGSR